MNNKIKTLIGFAVKSGKIIYGLDNIESARKKPYIVFICESTAENSKKKLFAYAEKNKLPILVAKAERLELLVNKTNCKIAAITDKMMAKGILDGFASDEFFEKLDGGIAN